MDNVTKTYIGIYKLKKCLYWQFKRINLMAAIFIILLLCIAIFQQLYYPRQIEQNTISFRKHLEYLQFTYGNITNAFEDLKSQVEDYNADKWSANIKEINRLIENLDGKISYYESSINNYFSASRTKRQKLIF